MHRFPYSLDGKKCPPPGPGAGSLWPVGEVLWWSGLPTGHPGSLCSYSTRYAEILPPVLLSGIRCRFCFSVSLPTTVDLFRKSSRERRTRWSVSAYTPPYSVNKDVNSVSCLQTKTWTMLAVSKQRCDQCQLSANNDVKKCQLSANKNVNNVSC